MQISLHQLHGQIRPVYNSHRQLVETSRPPSSLKNFGLDHKNSLVCTNCTVAESHIYFYSLGQLLNHLVSQFQSFIHVCGPCWYQHWRQIFFSSKDFSCNDQLIPQLHERLKSASPIVSFCTSQNSLSSFLNFLSFTSK